MAVLKFIVDFDHFVDWRGGRETPVGAAGQVRPHRRKTPRRLTARPTESECPDRKSTARFNRAKNINVVWSENQHAALH